MKYHKYKVKRSASVTPEVRLLILLHAGDKTYKLENPLRRTVILSFLG